MLEIFPRDKFVIQRQTSVWKRKKGESKLSQKLPLNLKLITSIKFKINRVFGSKYLIESLPVSLV